MLKKILLSSVLVLGIGGAAFAATNAFFSDTETSTGNTFQAGSLDLQIASKCTYNGEVSTQCGTWDFKSLTQDKFFNFTDVKPGDWGENTISFKILNNPAWMCANLSAVNEQQLGNYLNVFWWVDDGDNVYETGEKVLYGGPRTLSAWLALGGGSSLPLTFADSVWHWIEEGVNTPVNPIPALTEQHLGVAWCFGDMTVDGTVAPGFTCDGSGDQNTAQGDVVTAALSFTIEQHRNNAQFMCPEHVVPTEIPAN